MSRRLLLLVTTQTYRAGAFIAASRALEVDLTVASERAQALASLHPQGHLLIDFRAPGAALAQIHEFAARHPVHAVIGADDECAVLAARAAEMLGLRGAPSVAVGAARDKAQARESFAAAGLHTPPFAVVPHHAPAAVVAGGPGASEAPAELRAVGFPCVLKPRGLSASRGVIRANDAAQFAAAFARIRHILETEGPAGPDERTRQTTSASSGSFRKGRFIMRRRSSFCRCRSIFPPRWPCLSHSCPSRSITGSCPRALLPPPWPSFALTSLQ